MPQPTEALLALADFNDARLDEDERLAKGATPGPWRHSPEKHWRKPGTSWFEEAVFAGAPGEGAVCVAGTGETDDPQSMADAACIARHHPARVLAEVEGKRLLIANWRELILRIDAEPNAEKRERLALTRHGLDQFAHQMAAVHNEHPDYRREWRP